MADVNEFSHLDLSLHLTTIRSPTSQEPVANSSTSPESDVVELPYSEVAINFMVRYYIWFIVILGFPGNLLSFITIMKMSRLKSSTFYVAVLASVDNLCIILKATFMELRYHPHVFSSFGCKFICFFGLMTAALSNWLLVAMAAERFMAVRFPLKVATMWTLKRTIVLTLLILFLLSAIHLHIFWTMENGVYGCVYIPKYAHFTATYWYWISASLYAFIPCTVLIFFNVLIVQRVKQSSKLRRRLTIDRGDLPPMMTSPRTKLKRTSSGNNDIHITMMLISVTIVFVILTIPRCAVMLIIHDGGPETSDIVRQRLDVVTSFFADSNHAVNFYLYFFAAKQFRYHFFRLFGRRMSAPVSGSTIRKTGSGKDVEKDTEFS